jgi:hypothetical protein
VSHYQFPSDPRGYGLPRLYPGRELVYSFAVPAGARNAGAAVVSGRAVPQLLMARDENRLGGETALPVALNPYLDRWGSSEPVTGALLPTARRLYVVVETAPGSRPGPFSLRVWTDDRTPPTIGDVTRTVSGTERLRFRVRDAKSGVSWKDLVVRIDGEPADGVAHAGDVASVAVGGLRAGRHTLAIEASDLQETKNSENASPFGTPNSRRLFTTFRVSP